jgi:Leucine-rich repeat (LRR) protein
LTDLYSITLENCPITSLPESFGNLQKLSSISLHSCPITSLPESFGNLKNLSIIILNKCPITNLPESVGDLDIDELSIRNCPLTSLPESIGKMNHIKSLMIYNTKITSLPESICNLKTLNNLFFDYTALTHLPNELDKLVNLDRLILNKTRITSLPESICNLPKLRSLEIITGPLTSLPDNISNLKNLTRLHVIDTKITTLPESISKLEKISEIILDHNRNLNSLPDSIRNIRHPVTIRLNETELARNRANLPQNLPDNITIIIPARLENVHKKSAKIDFEKISDFIIGKMRKDDIPENLNYAGFIQNILTQFITNVYEVKPDEVKQEQRLNKLALIMIERLRGLNYNDQPPAIKNAVLYSLKYINSQPEKVQEYYIDNLLDDCIEAYAESNRQISCAAGILERIVTTMVPALTPFKENNRDYQTIIDLIEITPEKHIPELIKQWYQYHKTGSANAFPAGTSDEDKQKNLKNFLLNEYPEEHKLIDHLIIEYKHAIGFDEDSFTYGGRRRSNKKSKRSNKTPNKKAKKTPNKTPNKKAKKTRKHK